MANQADQYGAPLQNMVGDGIGSENYNQLGLQSQHRKHQQPDYPSVSMCVIRVWTKTN